MPKRKLVKVSRVEFGTVDPAVIADRLLELMRSVVSSGVSCKENQP
ncbi:hypothetical protein C7445_101191 [Alicyclobacillus sacchari]|uniref:Uncharacterized protein n=1 Tax=Alicyclobacillus sacchari TaxID=392010 RepID=A0A4V3HF26_9BACL|nr:hypothetical protein [Alicyclobacillus sacchari]TDY51191.1 hypothetical protein C7445_101191 [Alicyclobacillus sacchari]